MSGFTESVKSISAVSSSDLISCTRQKGLHFDKLPWCREGWFHETPHEGVDQSCRDASPPLHLVQYLRTTAQSPYILKQLQHQQGLWRILGSGPRRLSHLSVCTMISRNIWHLCKNNKVFCGGGVALEERHEFLSMPVGLENPTRRAHRSVLGQTSFCLKNWFEKQCFYGHVISSPLFSPSHCFYVSPSHTRWTPSEIKHRILFTLITEALA